MDLLVDPVELAAFEESIQVRGTCSSPPSARRPPPDSCACRRCPGAGRSRHTTTTPAGPLSCASRCAGRSARCSRGCSSTRDVPARGDVVHRVPHQLEAPIVVVTARQSVLVVDGRVAGIASADQHVVHLDEHVGILGVDPPGEFDVRPHVIFLGERHGMAVRGVVAAAVLPVAVVHEERHAVGAIGQQPLGRLVEIRL